RGAGALSFAELPPQPRADRAAGGSFAPHGFEPARLRPLAARGGAPDHRPLLARRRRLRRRAQPARAARGVEYFDSAPAAAPSLSAWRRAVYSFDFYFSKEECSWKREERLGRPSVTRRWRRRRIWRASSSGGFAAARPGSASSAWVMWVCRWRWKWRAKGFASPASISARKRSTRSTRGFPTFPTSAAKPSPASSPPTSCARP